MPPVASGAVIVPEPVYVKGTPVLDPELKFSVSVIWKVPVAFVKMPVPPVMVPRVVCVEPVFASWALVAVKVSKAPLEAWANLARAEWRDRSNGIRKHQGDSAGILHDGRSGAETDTERDRSGEGGSNAHHPCQDADDSQTDHVGHAGKLSKARLAFNGFHDRMTGSSKRTAAPWSPRARRCR
jgi:hypothetical protein